MKKHVKREEKKTDTDTHKNTRCESCWYFFKKVFFYNLSRILLTNRNSIQKKIIACNSMNKVKRKTTTKPTIKKDEEKMIDKSFVKQRKNTHKIKTITLLYYNL